MRLGFRMAAKGTSNETIISIAILELEGGPPYDPYTLGNPDMS